MGADKRNSMQCGREYNQRKQCVFGIPLAGSSNKYSRLMKAVRRNCRKSPYTQGRVRPIIYDGGSLKHVLFWVRCSRKRRDTVASHLSFVFVGVTHLLLFIALDFALFSPRDSSVGPCQTSLLPSNCSTLNSSPYITRWHLYATQQE